MRAIAAILALLVAMPASAQSVMDTHVEQAGVAGKTPTKAYRPLAREACRTATNHHQTGKIPLTPQVARDASCQTELAARDTNERRD